MRKHVTFYSQNITAIIKRIDAMPKLYAYQAEMMAKGRAERLIELFQMNIRRKRFGLIPLKTATIRAKQNKGYKFPDVPLYGLGEDHKYTFINSLYIKKMKNRYQVLVRDHEHISKRLDLAMLFDIHEYGAVLRNGMIPPRPAFRFAYNLLMQEISRNKKESAKEVISAIASFVWNGNKAAMNKMRKRGTSGKYREFYRQ